MDSVGARVVTAAISGLVGKGASKEYAAAVRAAHDAARAAPGAPFGAEWFRSTIAAVAGPTVIVFYRGLWCPYCEAYLRPLQELVAEIRAAGGQVFVFSSEPQDYVDAAKRKWGLPGLQMFGDTHSSLARHLRSAGLCAVHVSHPTDDAWTGGHPFMRYYTNGIAQPAVVVVDAEGKPLYAQATRPALANGGGAGDRADLAQVWAAVRPRAAGAPPPRPVRVRRLSELSPAATFALLAAPALIAAVIVSLYRRGARVVAVALAAAFLVVVRAGVRRNMALR